MSYLFPTYARWEIEPISAEGSYITARDGATYLDLTSGIGVCNLGHCPENVKVAIEEQLNHFWHVSNLLINDNQEKAAKRLATSAGLDAVYFANSGTEANEGAIKLARKATGKSKIITFEQSFHGRTFGSMSATGQDKIKSGYGPLLEKFTILPFNDIERLKHEMNDEVAGVMLEIVQGEGGVHVAERQFLKEMETLCREYGALMIIDEIQTGIGRTGKPFAFQHYDILPDIVTAAKGLGSGLPIGAVIGNDSLKEYFGPGSHGSTFGGNPLSISAAIETMNTIFNRQFLENVVEKGNWFREWLGTYMKEENCENVIQIRGLGLMLGIQTKKKVEDMLKSLRQEGILALPAGEYVLRLLPPLTITLDELKRAARTIAKVIG